MFAEAFRRLGCALASLAGITLVLALIALAMVLFLGYVVARST